MKRLKIVLSASVFALLVFMLLVCQKSPTNPDTPPAGATRNGYYIVLTPYAGTTLKTDTTINITWNSTTNVTDVNVKICLYRNDTLLQVITGSTANDGTNLYSFASVSPGSHYRIKISGAIDTAKFDFGGYFTIKNRYSGTITLTSPVDTTTARVGNAIPVRWTTTDSIGPIIYLQLYSDTVPTGSSYSATTSLNSYSFPLASSLIAGPKFRIKAWSYYNSSIFDFSDYFTLKSRYFGTITVTSPVDTTVALLGSSLPVRWTTTDSIGAIVSIQLYRDTVAVGTAYTASTSTGVYSYSVPASLVPGSLYRMKVSSYYDAGIFAYSPRFTIKSQYDGGYTITIPDSGTVWAAGSYYTIQWTTTGTPGSYVTIALFRNADSVGLITSSASNVDSYQWTIPSGLITAATYRIRVASYYDPTIYAMSKFFTVSGLQPDQYEVDNSRATASTIALGSAQNHTLTYGDTDFVAMTLDSGKTYIFTTTGTAYTYNYLYSSTDSLSAVTSYSSYSGTGSTRWVCTRTGKFYNRITPYSASYSGPYTFTVALFDSLTSAKFIIPDTATVWAAGSSYTVTWTPDTALFGTQVYLYLWDDTRRNYVSYMSSVNGGSSSFTVPAGLATGKNYRMKMVNYNSATIFGYSKNFTISGITPDGFEPDNNRASASTLVLGSPQSHTLSLNDTDFVAMNLDSGKTYSFSNKGTAYTYNYLYSSTDSISALTSFSSYSGTGSMRWACPRTGKYYTRITPYSSSYTGAYNFSVTQFDTLTSAKFTIPDSNTVWAGGSNYTITWTPDSVLFGTYIALYLWDESVRTQWTIGTYIANGGTYSYTVPAALATKNSYRIKMVNYSAATVYGYSKRFSITGLAPDAFEPDNKRATASTFIFGSPQTHSLTLSDTDYVAITCDSGQTYRFSTTGPAYAYHYLYSSADSINYLTNYSSYGGSGTLRWVCPKAGKYFTRITPYSTSYTGAYVFSVAAWDSVGSAKFITPDSSATWAAGSSYTVTWTPDSAIFGATVYMYLWDEKRRMLVSSMSSPNGGSCLFAIPAGLESGKYYRMKMVNYSTSANYGYSQRFTISGMAPDAFEPDDSASLAKPIATDSTIQTRTLTRGDVDWVTFSPAASLLYVIGVACSSSTTVKFYASNPALATPDQTAYGTLSNDAKITWFCTAGTKSYFSVTSTAAAGFRAWVKAYDSSAYRFTVSSPAAGASYAAGAALPITWSAKIPLGGTVDIFLHDASNTPQTIAANVTNSGSYSGMVPATAAPGAGYYIKVLLHNSSEVYGKSGTFTITQ